MPRLVVVVDKDDTGKLWNYVFAEQGPIRGQVSFGPASLWIHKPYVSDETSGGVRLGQPAEMDNVTVGVLLPEEQPRAAARTRKRPKVKGVGL